RRGPFSKGQGILLVYSGIMAVLGGIGLLTVPTMTGEVGKLVENLPATLANARTTVEQIQNPSLRSIALNALNSIAPSDRGGAPPVEPASALAVGIGVVEAVFSAVTIFIIAY